MMIMKFSLPIRKDIQKNIDTMHAKNEGCNLTCHLYHFGYSAVPLMQDGRKSILKLADRMMRSYHAGVSASPENVWKPIPIPGAEDILVTTRYSEDDPQTPRGVCITVATTIWLPNHPSNVFEFLRNGDHRRQVLLIRVLLICIP